MKHLQKISQFLYFQLASIFLVLVYMHSSYPKIENQSFMYVFFTILLLPILEKTLWWVFEKINSAKYLNKHFVLWCIVLLIGLGALWFTNIFSLPLLILALLIFSWYYSIDGRVFFLWALVIFLYVMLSLILWSENIAEGLSIIAYYLLVAWVVSGVLENISFTKKSHA